MIAARRLTTTPEEERVKDVWDLGVFGLGEKRAMDFTQLHQRWLRESVKGYTIERLSSRKLRTAHRDLGWMRHLSEYLRARDDRGEQPSALTREDMTAFLSWLRVQGARQQHAQPDRRRDAPQRCSSRAGISRSPARPPSVSAAGFSSTTRTSRARTLRDPDEPGRALPPVVLAQLLDKDMLAPLGAKYLEYRLGFELIAHSGRRPGGDLQPRGGLPALRGGASAGWRQAAPAGVALPAREAAEQVAQPADQPGRRRADRGPATAPAGQVPGTKLSKLRAVAAAQVQPDRAAANDLPDARATG